ncbi:hypothetical protein FVE85_5917 [Porphyridium purpureum]|uniref:Uncharacterized protein n=1 Tax=Porphyridium purpureum TaxID=35688 RepID=A0A5J4Z5G8_PORPP|nr:hypothetical protein FVE85_5917 [Porphyridium purpureum]|eukprot:POR9194..scf295_1
MLRGVGTRGELRRAQQAEAGTDEVPSLDRPVRPWKFERVSVHDVQVRKWVRGGLDQVELVAQRQAAVRARAMAHPNEERAEASDAAAKQEALQENTDDATAPAKLADASDSLTPKPLESEKAVVPELTSLHDAQMDGGLEGIGKEEGRTSSLCAQGTSHTLAEEPQDRAKTMFTNREDASEQGAQKACDTDTASKGELKHAPDASEAVSHGNALQLQRSQLDGPEADVAKFLQQQKEEPRPKLDDGEAAANAITSGTGGTLHVHAAEQHSKPTDDILSPSSRTHDKAGGNSELDTAAAETQERSDMEQQAEPLSDTGEARTPAVTQQAQENTNLIGKSDSGGKLETDCESLGRSHLVQDELLVSVENGAPDGSQTAAQHVNLKKRPLEVDKRSPADKQAKLEGPDALPASCEEQGVDPSKPNKRQKIEE